MGGKKIDDATMENVEILAKLWLSPEERETARASMEEILAYIDKLNELDTDGVEPLVHIFEEGNVFRRDAVINGNGERDALMNAPRSKDGQYMVPKTV